MQRTLSLAPNLQYTNADIIPNFVLVNDFSEVALKTFIIDFDKVSRSGTGIIPIVIDSFGGGVHALFGMISVIRSCQIPVATIVSSKAMSAGVVLFSCGTKGYRFASPLSYFMVHEVSSWNEGKMKDIETDVEHGQEMNRRLLEILDENCGKKRGWFGKEIDKRSNTDWYLNAKEARKIGLADKIKMPSLKVEVLQKVTLV